MSKSTIASLIYEIEAAGGDRFVANVIACWHSNPVRKLRGMLRLAKAGHRVDSTASRHLGSVSK